MDAQQAHNIEYLIDIFRSGGFGDGMRSVVEDFPEDMTGQLSPEEVGGKLVERCEDRLLQILGRTSSREELQQVKRAIDTAKEAHKDALRDEGVPYVLHPLRVALILAQEAGITDTRTIIGAILHDVIEDTDLTFEDVQKNFGLAVALCVNALTEKEGDNVDTMLIKSKQAHSLGAVLIRIADRIDNLRTLVHKKGLGKRLDKIEETQRYYVPFARWVSPRLSATLHSVLEGAYERVRQDDLYEDEIRSRLKDFFFEAHERITAVPVFKNVTTKDIRLEDYAEYLKVGFGIFSALEGSVENSPLLAQNPNLWTDGDNRSHLLLQDLEFLGVPTRQRYLSDLTFTPPKSDELPGFLASLYVLRGARLGGVTVRGKVEQGLGLSHHQGATFLNSFGDGQATFKKFQDYLDTVGTLVNEGSLTLVELGESLRTLFDEIERYSVAAS